MRVMYNGYQKKNCLRCKLANDMDEMFEILNPMI